MKWISVDERLPEVGVSVVTAGMGKHWFAAKLLDSGEWVESCSGYELRVTHWMLPDPPQIERLKEE